MTVALLVIEALVLAVLLVGAGLLWAAPHLEDHQRQLQADEIEAALNHPEGNVHVLPRKGEA